MTIFDKRGSFTLEDVIQIVEEKLIAQKNKLEYCHQTEMNNLKTMAKIESV